MNKLKKLYGPVLAPWVTLAGRFAGSEKTLERAMQLDPHSFRPQLLRAEAQGRLTAAPSRLLIAAKLALASGKADELILGQLPHSRAQLLQDIVALLASNMRKGGYFVEVGVGDGENLSNSLLLERQFGWNGILVEPNRDSHNSIRATRKARLVTKAAYSRGGERVVFTSMEKLGELSGIGSHLDSSRVTADSKSYEVTTETLDQILKSEAAPLAIDFMSIDTEGSEIEVLKGLSFDRWKVDFLAIEHNHQPGKLSELRRMLEPVGYRQVLSHVSEFDAWFLHSRVASNYLP
jgi:FkbM family methyltransferase